jgi:hypothetical protein
MPATTYAVVQDVPASWNVYLLRATEHGQMPEGLLFHAAGPTDEGFRVIDVWESQADWEHFRDRQQPGPIDGSLEAQLSRSTIRDLQVHDLYLTSSNPSLGRTT